MKVLHVINSLSFGGAEKVVLNSIIALFNNSCHENELLLLYNPSKSLINHLDEIDIKVHILGNSKRSIYNPYNIVKLKRIINNFDIIHVHLFPSFYWVALAKVFFLKSIPLVLTEHSPTNNRRKWTLFKMFERHVIYRQYNKIICISSTAKEELTKYLGNSNNMVIIHNGIPLSELVTNDTLDRSIFNLSSSDYILIMVASFRYPKDQDTLIKALVNLEADVKLILVGDGPRLNLCKQLACDLGVEDRIIFTGNRTDVLSILKMSNIIVLSSFYEGLSLSCLEGMSLGRPFIATNTIGLKELVGGAGLLFNDCVEFVDLVNSLRKNTSLYEKVACKCLMRVKEYDIIKTIEKLEKVYHQILNH